MNYYEILEVSQIASQEVISAAYKSLAKQYHPDMGKYPKQVCEEKMRELNLAYDTLSNKVKRDLYDKSLQERVSKANTEYKTKEDKGYYANNDFQKENTDEDVNSMSASKGVLIRAFETVGKELLKNKQKVENTFYAGLDMNDFELVLNYKRSTGLNRVGYRRALEERGLLYRSSDGKVIASETFKRFWRGC